MSVDHPVKEPLASPAFGDPAAPARLSHETLELLAQRRSTVADMLREPGPSAHDLEALLAVSARVPDHGKLAPWRFLVFEGDARSRAGEILAAVARSRDPEMAEDRLAIEQRRFARAPVVVAVVSRVTVPHKIPEWEQVLSAGAVCQTLLIAAHAMGYAGQWLTEWCAYDADVLAAFGLKPGERIAGYVYLGTAASDPMERKRPDVAAITRRWDGRLDR